MVSKLLKQNFIATSCKFMATAAMAASLPVIAAHNESVQQTTTDSFVQTDDVFRRDWLAPFQVSQNALAAGDFPVAMRSALEALTIYSSDWLTRVDNTAILLLKNLADIHQQQGNVEAALSYYQRVLNHSIDLYGAESFAVASLRYDLAKLLYNQSTPSFEEQYPRVILMAQQAHQALSALGGKADYLRFEVSLFLAAAYRYQNINTALIYALEAKQLGEQLTGPYEHEITVASHTMARLYNLLGRQNLADETYRQTQRLILKDNSKPFVKDRYNRDQAWANKIVGQESVSNGFWQKVLAKDIANLELPTSDIPIAACVFGEKGADVLLEVYVNEGVISHHELMAGSLSGFQSPINHIEKLLDSFQQTLKPFHNGVHLIYSRCGANGLADDRRLISNQQETPAWPSFFLSGRVDVLDILAESTDSSVQAILRNYQKYRDRGDFFAAIALMNDFRFLNQGIIDGFSINEWDVAGLYALFHDVASDIGFKDQAISALGNMLGVIARATPDEETETVLIQKALGLIQQQESNNPLLAAESFLDHLSNMRMPLYEEALIRWNFYEPLLYNDNINAEAQNLTRQLDGFGREGQLKALILKMLAFNPVRLQPSNDETSLFDGDGEALSILYRERAGLALGRGDNRDAKNWFERSFEILNQPNANWFNRPSTKSHVWYGPKDGELSLIYSLTPMVLTTEQLAMPLEGNSDIIPAGVYYKHQP